MWMYLAFNETLFLDNKTSKITNMIYDLPLSWVNYFSLKTDDNKHLVLTNNYTIRCIFIGAFLNFPQIYNLE